MGGSQSVPLGTLGPWSGAGDYNTIVFAIQQQLSKVQTATLCRVESCTNDGALAPFGFVDVTPLVSQVDGAGNPVNHVTLFKIPYLRLQGGSSALILDPQVGDVGICMVCSRDISTVVATQAQSTPGSPRQFNWADGLYLGGLLNAAPSQYLQFSSSGVTVVAPNNVTVTAPAINAGASGSTPQALMNSTFLSWFTSTVMPFLASKGFVGTVPSGSATTNLKGA